MFKYVFNSIKHIIFRGEINRSDPLFNLYFSINFLRPLLIIGLTGALLICIPQANIVRFGAMLLWIMACIVVGAATGFLFGFPRSGKAKNDNDKAASESETNGTARPNTNLEEISDWLTKIIVGLSLVNIREISITISTISKKIALSMSVPATEANHAIGFAIITGFLTVGFFYGYFYTRLFLQQAFGVSDRKLLDLVDTVVNATASHAPISEAPTLPSKTEIKNAEQIADLVPSGKNELITNKIQELASLYEKTRYEMPSGDTRTRRMTEIASSMRQLGQAAVFMLPKLTASYIAGERLAAICILQMSFDPHYIDWLADRIHAEKPFLAYHAASALYGRMLNTNQSERKLIHTTVSNAKSKLTYPESGRDYVIERILELATTRLE